MYAAAQFKPLPVRYVQVVPHAAVDVAAVFPAPRRAGVARGDNIVVFHNDRAEVAPQAGPALRHGLRNVQIVVVLIPSAHLEAPLFHGRFVRSQFL